MTAAAPQNATKSVENTVFLRFTPYNPEIRRHAVQDIASEVGPIKKCSIIHKNDRSYGFVKFTCPEDARTAAVQLNQRKIGGRGGTIMHAELAAAANRDSTTTTSNKKTSRLILRNLSFYAKEKDIRKVLEPLFGTLQDVHIPMVGEKQPRGFAFVTFADATAAQACLDHTAAPIVIRNRPVQVARAMHKTAYESVHGNNKKEKAEMIKPMKETDEEDDSDSHDDEANDDEISDGEEGSDEESESDNDEKEDDDKRANHDRTAVAEKRCIFMRNLPFDCTRHDVFQLFRQFGYVTAIYLVKENNVPKGTAFVSFKTPEQAEEALSQAASTEFVSQQDALSQSNTSGLFLKGRQVFVNLAVDKETAKTLTTETGTRDRRNLYLKDEGRVENTESSTAWDDLPESDKMKRQTAWSDKNTKLKSPLFFINPTRLSIRNLSKSVDEAGLKRLCALAVTRGLSLVNTQDQVAHWKAAGTLNTRELLARAEEALPVFDEKNVKQYIPSVHIHRDFGGSSSTTGMSRGFGFCEFQHHAHALACLRELNNNPKYAVEYAAGQRNSRFIVEFTVENKVKARQQAEHKEKQRTNRIKQQVDEKKARKSKTKHRGAAQREKKRKQRENPDVVAPGQSTEAPKPLSESPNKSKQEQPKVKKVKPPKKKAKVDSSDAHFAKLVESYKKQAMIVMGGGAGDTTSDANSKTKRWFED